MFSRAGGNKIYGRHHFFFRHLKLSSSLSDTASHARFWLFFLELTKKRPISRERIHPTAILGLSPDCRRVCLISHSETSAYMCAYVSWDPLFAADTEKRLFVPRCCLADTYSFVRKSSTMH